MKAFYSAKVNFKCNTNLLINLYAIYITRDYIQNALCDCAQFKIIFHKSTGKKWHDRRKVLTPAFHFNILERFVETFDRIGNNVVDKLKKFDTTDDVEFYPIALLYALDVMCGELKWNRQLMYEWNRIDRYVECSIRRWLDFCYF